MFWKWIYKNLEKYAQKQQEVNYNQESLATPSISPEIDEEFRNQANNRIRELEERFERLCGHLEVRVYKPYGYVVEKGASLGGMSVGQNVPMQQASAQKSAK